MIYVRAVNVPNKLMDLLERQANQDSGKVALLIQISTDQVQPSGNKHSLNVILHIVVLMMAVLVVPYLRQVYDGGKSLWSESDECRPVNAYGRSKLEAEEVIRV